MKPRILSSSTYRPVKSDGNFLKTIWASCASLFNWEAHEHAICHWSGQVEDAARLVGAQTLPGSCSFLSTISEPQNWATEFLDLSGCLVKLRHSGPVDEGQLLRAAKASEKVVRYSVHASGSPLRRVPTVPGFVAGCFATDFQGCNSGGHRGLSLWSSRSPGRTCVQKFHDKWPGGIPGCATSPEIKRLQNFLRGKVPEICISISRRGGRPNMGSQRVETCRSWNRNKMTEYGQHCFDHCLFFLHLIWQSNNGVSIRFLKLYIYIHILASFGTFSAWFIDQWCLLDQFVVSSCYHIGCGSFAPSTFSTFFCNDLLTSDAWALGVWQSLSMHGCLIKIIEWVQAFVDR